MEEEEEEEEEGTRCLRGIDHTQRHTLPCKKTRVAAAGSGGYWRSKWVSGGLWADLISVAPESLP